MFVANQIENDRHYFVLLPVHDYSELDLLLENTGKTPKVALQSAIVNQFLTRNIH